MEKLDAFTRYLGNCGLFHFFDAIQKWVLVFTGIIVFVLTIATERSGAGRDYSPCYFLAILYRRSPGQPGGFPD